MTALEAGLRHVWPYLAVLVVYKLRGRIAAPLIRRVKR